MRKYINSYVIYLRNKSSNQVSAGFLHSLPIPTDHFSDITIDFIGTLPKSLGFDTITIFTDRLTNYIKIEPTHSTTTAEDIVRLAYRSWIRQFGLPRSIVSDRDKLFTSKFWKELHRLLYIDIKLSIVFHPETDGSSERSNKTTIEALRGYINHRGTDWASHLIQVELSMNNSINTTTQLTPTEMLYGTNIRLFPRL
jgi:transposase InsO family protein